MATVKLYSFAALGRGHFPMDMLRYDACWPADSGSASNLGDPLDDDLREVNLYSYRAPTRERWRSFGWGCSEPTVRKIQIQ